jgi:hypothetical protein
MGVVIAIAAGAATLGAVDRLIYDGLFADDAPVSR